MDRLAENPCQAWAPSLYSHVYNESPSIGITLISRWESPPGFVNHRLTSIWIFLLPGSHILAGPSSLRVLSDPWFCESQTYKYLGFPSSGSTFYTIFWTDFPRTTSPIKAYTWVDCGHNPPFSTIMKVGGNTTVYTCGRCIVFTPVTFWP